MPACNPATSIVSFPASIRTGVIVSQAMYDSVEEPLTVQFNWGTRSIAPQFEEGKKGLINEVGHGGLSVTTVYFNNITYNLYSAGLYAPSHNMWLINNRKSSNSADLILIFNNPNELIKTKYDFIFLVIPILETSSTEAPTYLNGLTTPGGKRTEGYSLQSCMPPNTSQFLYYATCLSSSTTSRSGSLTIQNTSATSKTGIVFLSVEGINVGSSILASIQSAPGFGGRFSMISEAPVNDQFNITSFLTQAGSVLSSTDITRYVLSTRVLFDTERTKNMEWVKGASSVRTDSQSSYKCVQFDPEKDLTDGNIKIDLTSGEILSKVLEERDIVIQSMNTLTDGKDQDGKYKYRDNLQFVPYFIGGILAFFLLFSVWIVWMKVNTSSPSTGVATAPVGIATTTTTSIEFLNKYWITILVSIFLFILGAVLGVLIALNGTIRNQTNLKETVKDAVAVSRANMTN